MKKKLPLDLILGFKPQENPNINLVKYTLGKDYLMNFLDNDSESEFYFKINSINNSSSKCLIYYKPVNASSVNHIERWCTIEELNTLFNNWLAIIKAYNNTPTIFDDPILTGFADEFYANIKFVEPDAEYAPFKTTQILFLEKHLEYIEVELGNLKNNENQRLIEEIIENTIELKGELRDKSKNYLLRKLTVIWAKLWKNGFPIAKEFIKEGFKEAMKIGIKSLME